MKFKPTIQMMFATFLLLNLIACSNTTNKTPPKNKLEQVEGPGHGGGGNGVNGKVYESYAINIENEPGYQTTVLPFFEKLADQNLNEKPETYLKIIQSKTWFVVPHHLIALDKKIIGVSHGVENTEQLAFQTDKELWIDESYYRKMSTEQQGALLLHEVLMMFYRFRFDSFYDLCLKGVLDIKNSNSCEQVKSFDLLGPAEALRDLNSSDYENIRQMVSYILTNQSNESVSSKDLKLKMLEMGFDRRYFTPVAIKTSEPNLGYPEKSFDLIIDAFNAKQSLNENLDRCYSVYLQNEVKCEIHFQRNLGERKIQYEIQYKNGDEVIRSNEVKLYQFGVMNLNLLGHYQIQSKFNEGIVSSGLVTSENSLIPISWNNSEYAFVMNYLPTEKIEIGQKTNMNIYFFKVHKDIFTGIKSYEILGFIAKKLAVIDVVYPSVGEYFKSVRCVNKSVKAKSQVDDMILIYHEYKDLELLKMLNSFDSFVDICY